jgi:hypothetical protein
MIEQSTAGLDVAVHHSALGDRRSTLAIQVDVEEPTNSSIARCDGDYVRAAWGGRAPPTMVEKEVQSES